MSIPSLLLLDEQIALLRRWYISVDEKLVGSKGVGYSMEGHREYTRVFHVRVRFKGMSPYMVCRAPYIPVGGSFYVSAFGAEYDTLALLTKKTAEPMFKEEGEWQDWMVTCEYTTNVRNKQPQNSQDHPEMELPEIEWDMGTFKLARKWDLSDNPITNSAHMPFMPAPVIDVGHPVLVITRNELGFDSKKASLYAYAINSDKFLGYPPEAVQCMPPKGRRTSKGSWVFWKVTYKLNFAPYVLNPDNPDAAEEEDYIYMPWQPRLLDEGMHHLDTDPTSPNNGKPIPIFDHGPLRHPVLLDGNGQRATESPPTPRFIDFTFYRTVSFNKLMVQGLA